MTSHIVIAVYLCAATCQPQQLRVWDGDSFLIGMKHGSERVRILGLDAAEIEGKCSYEIQMAKKAKRRLSELANGQRVQVFRNGKDKYGRTLARVLVNGNDVSQILINEGLARPWRGHREPWC
jgi:micrococcal nuclease